MQSKSHAPFKKLHFHSVAIFISGLTLASAAIAAPDYPQLAEADLQKLLDASRQGFESFQKVGSSYFNLPADKKDWACAVDANILAELSNTNNRKIREDAAQKVDLNFSEAVYYPVQSSCQGGKLSGPLEFWAEFVMTMSTKDVLMTYKIRQRFGGQVSNNYWVGAVVSAQKTLEFKSKYLDPQTEAMMANAKLPKTETYSFLAEVPGKPRNQSEPKATLMYTLVDGKPTHTLDVVAPKPESRKELRHYGTFGPLNHLDYTKQYKDEKLHGPTVTFAGMMGQFPIAPSTACYEEGEKVLTTNCNVR